MPNATEVDLSWNATNPQDTIVVQRWAAPSNIMTTVVLTPDQAAAHAFADVNLPAGSGTLSYTVSATFDGVMSDSGDSNSVTVTRTAAPPIQVGVGNAVEEDINLGGLAQPGDRVWVSAGAGFTVTSRAEKGS
jgi:hypothetical protein